jgi:hypothetical protein
MTQIKTVRRLVAGAALAVASLTLVAPAAPATPSQLDPGVCGHGHAGGVPVPFPESCSSCTGFASGPHGIDPLFEVYICARI